MKMTDNELWEKSQVWDSSDDGRGKLKILESVEHFAALVEAAARADEREACAKLCDEQVSELYASRDTVDCAEYLAGQIRARGTT